MKKIGKKISKKSSQQKVDSMKGKLGVYHMMIVSKYFEKIDDFFNLELATPKAKGNMAKFHYNPVTLDTWSRKFWTSLQTFHLYDRYDADKSAREIDYEYLMEHGMCFHQLKSDRFKDEQFYQRIVWYKVDAMRLMRQGKLRVNGNKIYKNVVFSNKYSEQDKTIPEGTTKIANDSFHNFRDKTVTEIVIPNTVETIGSFCFYDAENITKIVLSTNLKTIDSYSFKYLPGLKEIEIPNSVISIGKGFLDSCKNLTSMTVPKHWERKGKMFIHKIMTDFTSFTIPQSVIQINGETVSFENLEHFDIPTNITTLASDSFLDSQYTSISIPTTIKELPWCCFKGCKRLKEITIPTSITGLESGCFYECVSITSLTIPTSVVFLGRECFKRMISITSLIIPTSVVEIGDYSFQYMTSLKSIEIPTSITKFGDYLFSWCISLTSVKLHDNYKEVKNGDFSHCSSLSSIVLPSTVSRIGHSSFVDCKSLTSITIPSTLTNFDFSCFKDTGITKENYPQLPEKCFR